MVKTAIKLSSRVGREPRSTGSHGSQRAAKYLISNVRKPPRQTADRKSPCENEFISMKRGWQRRCKGDIQVHSARISVYPLWRNGRTCELECWPFHCRRVAILRPGPLCALRTHACLHTHGSFMSQLALLWLKVLIDIEQLHNSCFPLSLCWISGTTMIAILYTT